ncbi:MAG: acyltransferase family protein [Hyphomonas sp.]|nr:acyltransferase family protein [Hyphomonas sp.]
MAGSRVGWVDYAKGICIIMVVMMHSTIDYGHMVDSEGWLHGFVAWAKPLRMPDFFLIAGLFLHRSIFGARTSYIDRKLVHFAYFYALWLGIQTVLFELDTLAVNPMEVARIYAAAWIEPKSSLWFIHELAVFYMVTRLLRRLHAGKVFAVAAALQVLQSAGLMETGWSVTNRFAQYYVFFYAGYAFSPVIFKFADAVAERGKDMLRVAALWFAVHTSFVLVGAAALPVVSLILGLAGALAIVAAGVVLSRLPYTGLLRHTGRNSIVVYLGFFIPMKLMQKGLAATHLIPDVGTATLVITVASVGLALLAHQLVRNTPLNALYVRPQMFRLKGAKSAQRGTLLPGSVPNA